MELKDVLHLYLGCEGKDLETKEVFSLVTCSVEGSTVWKNFSGRAIGRNSNIIPILRPLSDMTEEEGKQFGDLVGNYGEPIGEREYDVYKNAFNNIVISWGGSMKEKYCLKIDNRFSAKEFQYLLSHHFDLFGLLESSQAISKTTL